MSLLQFLKVVVCFLILTELTRFLAKFCVMKFSSFEYGFDGLWNKEWQDPKLGDAPGRHPLFRLRLSVTILETIFLFTT